MSLRERLTEIMDSALDVPVREFHSEFRNAGYQSVQSQLLLRGIRTTQIRVRESLQRTDPDGVAMR